MQNDLGNGQWRQIRAMSGGGSLLDVGLYCLNAFRSITGEEPVAVTGTVTRPPGDLRFAEVEDACLFTLRFPSGVVATGSSAYSAHENRALCIVATEGWFGADPAFGYDTITMQVSRKRGMASGLEQRRFAPANQFATEMDATAEALRANAVPHTPGEAGLAEQRIMEAIYPSAAMRCRGDAAAGGGAGHQARAGAGRFWLRRHARGRRAAQATMDSAAVAPELVTLEDPAADRVASAVAAARLAVAAFTPFWSRATQLGLWAALSASTRPCALASAWRARTTPALLPP